MFETGQELELDVVLEPGQILYVPLGHLREGSVPADIAGNETSVHVTFSAEPGTLYDLFEGTDLAKMVGFETLLDDTRLVDPDTPQWKQYVTANVPRALRQELPPRLSHVCRTDTFRKLLQNTMENIKREQPHMWPRRPSIRAKAATALKRLHTISKATLAHECDRYIASNMRVFLSNHMAGSALPTAVACDAESAATLAGQCLSMDAAVTQCTVSRGHCYCMHRMPSIRHCLSSCFDMLSGPLCSGDEGKGVEEDAVSVETIPRWIASGPAAVPADWPVGSALCQARRCCTNPFCVTARFYAA